MNGGDFYGSEQSSVIDQTDSLTIQLIGDDGTTTDLREPVAVEAGEVVDAAVMSVRQLREFFAAQIEDARQSGLLLSLHLKATMMKVSDPHLVRPCGQCLFRRCVQESCRSTAVPWCESTQWNGGIGSQNR